MWCTQEKEPLQVRINVDGHPHVMHIQFGADVHAGVAEFAAKMGLSEDSKQALTKQVREPDSPQLFLFLVCRHVTDNIGDRLFR